MKKPLHVLIVEDSESDAAIVTRLLRKAGHDVHERRVDTARQMRAALDQKAWDVVICDYSMPQFDAPGALALLQETGQDIPFIVMSGTIGEDVAVAMMKAGAHDYLMKGHLARLAPAVERELRDAQNRRERRRAQDALRESEERFKGLFENVLIGLYRTTPDGRVLMANQALVRLLGHSSFEELANRNLEQNGVELSYPRSQFKALLERQSQVVGLETDWARTDGSTVFVRESSRAVRDQQGRILYYEGTVEDISERKRAEEALIASEARLRRAQAVARMGFLDWNLTTDDLELSDQVVEMYGLEPGGKCVTSEFVARVCHPEDAAYVVENLERAVKGEKQYNIDHRVVRPDGDVLWVHAQGELERDEQGHPVRLLGTVVDITARKQAEEALRQRASQLSLLNEIGGQVAALLDLDQVLDRAAQLVQQRFGFDRVGLFTKAAGQDRLVMRARAGESASVYPPDHSVALEEGLVGWVGRHGETLLTNDVDAEPRYRNPYPDRLPIRAELSVPMRIGGEIVGVLDLQSRTPNRFDADDVTAMETLAGQIAVAIHNARLYRQAAQRNRELALLNRVIAVSAATQDVKVILDTVCRELARALNVPRVFAALFDEARTKAVVVADVHSEHRPSLLNLSLPVPADLQTAHLDLDLDIENARTDPRLEPLRSLVHQFNAGSLRSLPLHAEEAAVGALVLADSQPRRFSDNEVELVRRAAEQVSGALARARMAEMQQRLSAAIEQAAEGVVITDAQDAIFYVNPAFEQITGYPQAEILGQSIQLLHSDRQDPAAYERLSETVAAGRMWQGRLVSRRRDGSLYTEETTISPVRDHSGEIVSYVATMRDVTREVELEEQFRQAQKMEAVGRLAGGVAHDFNNLLTVIHLSIRLLEKKLRIEDPLWQHVQRIQDASQRATALIKQLLAFSRRDIVEPRVLDLNQVVGEMDKMLRRLIGEDVELTTRLAGDLWPVRIGPSQVEQVVVNLAVNARDAMPIGGKLTLETANEVLDAAYAAHHLDVDPGEYVVLAISDTGEGMSDEVKAHLFEPFFTTKEEGKGTGLGLATVFGIIKQNRGHIWVYSELDRGTTFKIYLPRAGMPRVSEGTHGLSGLPTEGAAPSVQSSETLLLVEDEAGVRELVTDILRARGYRVLEAKDGVQALQVAEEHEGPIHLLLTDVVMPHLSGRALADQLRSSRPEMRVLFTSGYTDNAIVHHGVLAQGVHFLSKPFGLETLVRKVRAVLDAVHSE